MTCEETNFSPWKPLFLISCVFCVALLILISIDDILFVISPRPTTVLEYFELLQSNPFLGLVALDLLYVIDQALIIPIILSLYVTLKHINKSVVLVATVSCIVALSTYMSLIGLVLLTTSLIFFIIWDVLLLRSFIKLSRGSN